MTSNTVNENPLPKARPKSQSPSPTASRSHRPILLGQGSRRSYLQLHTGGRPQQARVIGMVVPDITNPFYPAVIRGAEAVAARNGFLIATVNTEDQLRREKQGLAMLLSSNVKGLLLVVTKETRDFSHIRRFTEAGLPVVCLDRVPVGMPFDSVCVDHLKGSQVCVRHLISMGHRRIAAVTGPRQLESNRERLEGYRLALREANLRADLDVILEGSCEPDSGYRLTKQLLRKRVAPSALFVTSGTLGLGVMRALEATGWRCPEDIAVATFDDFASTPAFRPRLTAVGQPAHHIGRQAAQLLLDRLQGHLETDQPVRIRLEPEVRVRESTLAYRGSVREQRRAVG